MANQVGSVDLRLVNDIPVGNSSLPSLTVTSDIKAIYPNTSNTGVKVPFAPQVVGRTLHFDDVNTFNRAANNPMPNTAYKYSGVTWTTDNLSCVSTVEGYVGINPANNRLGVDVFSTTVLGEGGDSLAGDVGFHLLGDIFGGATNKVNVVLGNGRPLSLADGTILKNINQGCYKTEFEYPIAEIDRQTAQKFLSGLWLFISAIILPIDLIIL
ncbi:DNA/RNA non-specific endonuclease [Acinetobacter gerneri]|uniref:DNA/RNA non-specific endonuclease n=1 Tax=Acinetobacter gerneri TaxID=202952 RepID=UPI003A8B69F6